MQTDEVIPQLSKLFLIVVTLFRTWEPMAIGSQLNHFRECSHPLMETVLLVVSFKCLRKVRFRKLSGGISIFFSKLLVGKAKSALAALNLLYQSPVT